MLMIEKDRNRKYAQLRSAAFDRRLDYLGRGVVCAIALGSLALLSDCLLENAISPTNSVFFFGVVGLLTTGMLAALLSSLVVARILIREIDALKNRCDELNDEFTRHRLQEMQTLDAGHSGGGTEHIVTDT